MHATGTELGLLRGERGRRALEQAARRLPADEGDVDLRYLLMTELEVTDAAPVVVRRFTRTADERADAVRRDRGLALREPR